MMVTIGGRVQKKDVNEKLLFASKAFSGKKVRYTPEVNRTFDEVKELVEYFAGYRFNWMMSVNSAPNIYPQSTNYPW